MPALTRSARKQKIVEHADQVAGERAEWIRKNAYYYDVSPAKSSRNG